MASLSEGERVLVTGYTGFTGRYVAEALARAGFDPVGPDASRFDLTRVETVEESLEEIRPDYVIHLAALSFVAHGDAGGMYAVNAVGTTNLLDAVLNCTKLPKRLIISSSANVYGNAVVEPIDESVAPAPVNHYAVSKLAMEHLARTYQSRLPIVVTRPFNYTGVGQGENFLVPKLVAHFADRQPAIELGNLDVVRDFSDVRAVAEAYVRLLHAEVPARLVNICSGKGYALGWVLDRLRTVSGHEIEVRVNPTLVRSSEIKSLVGDCSRLRAAIGELPYQDFTETLAWMFEERSRISKPAAP